MCYTKEALLRGIPDLLQNYVHPAELEVII